MEYKLHTPLPAHTAHYFIYSNIARARAQLEYKLLTGASTDSMHLVFADAVPKRPLGVGVDVHLDDTRLDCVPAC